MLHATFEETGEALLVTPLVPSLDAEAAPALCDLVGDRARGRVRVVLSLAHVATVDCSGLAGLVSVWKRMAPGGELRLVDASRPVRALLAETHLDAVFPVYEDTAMALAS